MDTKHTKITETLRESIRHGKYSEKLPPLRELMNEFHVSMQTISKAVRPLSNEGLILPGPRGSVIVRPSRRKPCYYTVGLILNAEPAKEDVHGKNSIEEIRGIVSEKGFNLMLLDKRNSRMRNNPSFWETLPVDAVFFDFGSLTPELANAVFNAGILGISRHYAGDLPIHVLEYDTFAAIAQVLEMATEKNYRRIALQFAVPLEGFNDFANRKWDELRRKYRIEYPEYRETVMLSNNDSIERHTEYLCLSNPPELILCWHVHAWRTYEVLKSKNLHHTIKLISIESPWQKQECFYPLAQPEQETYYRTVMEFVASAMETPPPLPVHKLIYYKADLIHELPNNNRSAE